MEGVIEEILRRARTIAVVGLSPSPDRPSHRVAAYLQRQGYRIIPVNPAATEVLGERSYPSLEEVPERIDVVDLFRRAEEAPAVVEQAIRIGAWAVWMQEGIVHQEAAARAEQAGLMVAMNRCMLTEHFRQSQQSRAQLSTTEVDRHGVGE